MPRNNGLNFCVCLPDLKDPLHHGEEFHFLHRVKGNVLLWGKPKSQFPFQAMVGPNWTCMCITYALIIVCSFFFVINVANDFGLGMIIPFLIGSGVLLVIFSFTACSDPGIAFTSPEDIDIDPENQNQNGYINCNVCEVKRPITASHCYDCGVCVDELDHHCPWTGKCIGKKNLGFFHKFLAVLGFQVAFCIIGVIASIIAGHNPMSPS